MTLHDHLAAARMRFERAGIEPSEATRDAELLARQALGWNRARLIADRHQAVPSHFEPSFARLVDRRERREPASYILGTREFWGLELEVSPDVLIPRPESELIVEEALRCLATPDARGCPVIVDVGTGSGCLAIALAKERPDARIIATDVSTRALAVARRNAGRHGVSSRVSFVAVRFLAGIRTTAHLIVSNPPYVPEGVVGTLAPEVRDHEPRVALAGGVDGLAAIQTLIEQAWRKLSARGWFIVEFGFGQEHAIRSLISRNGRWELTAIARDIQGVFRTAVLRKAATGCSDS